jgi:hypothetical protein
MRYHTGGALHRRMAAGATEAGFQGLPQHPRRIRSIAQPLVPQKSVISSVYWYSGESPPSIGRIPYDFTECQNALRSLSSRICEWGHSHSRKDCQYPIRRDPGSYRLCIVLCFRLLSTPSLKTGGKDCDEALPQNTRSPPATRRQRLDRSPSGRYCCPSRRSRRWRRPGRVDRTGPA